MFIEFNGIDRGDLILLPIDRIADIQENVPYKSESVTMIRLREPAENGATYYVTRTPYERIRTQLALAGLAFRPMA